MNAETLEAESLATIESCIRGRARNGRGEQNPCLATRQTGPIEWGTLAFDVCGLPKDHGGYHRAGWSGTGSLFLLRGEAIPPRDEWPNPFAEGSP